MILAFQVLLQPLNGGDYLLACVTEAIMHTVHVQYEAHHADIRVRFVAVMQTWVRVGLLRAQYLEDDVCLLISDAPVRHFYPARSSKSG